MTARGAERGSTLVELLVASALGLGIVLAAVQMLKTHALLALQVQADLGASGGAAWALRAALRDVKRAGADPLQRNIAALAEAGPDRLTTLRDVDADGVVDSRSEETVGLSWSDAQGGSVLRRVGEQSMAIVSQVLRGGLRLRYYDAAGREILSPGGLGEADRRRVRRVEVDVEVREAVGTVSGRASLSSAASVRVREGQP